MKDILTFNEFLNEGTISIPLLIDSGKFLTNILNVAKKGKLIKNFHGISEYDKSEYYNVLNTPGDKFVINVPGQKIFCDMDVAVKMNNQVITVSLGMEEKYALRHEKEEKYQDRDLYRRHTSYDLEVLNPANVVIVSDSPIDLKLFESIFENELVGTVGKKIKTFTRKILVDKSNTLSPMEKWSSTDEWRNNPNGGRKLVTHANIHKADSKYYVVFQYDSVESEAKGTTLDELKTTSEYKDLMDSFPLDMVSNDLQKRKMTIVFALKSDHFLDMTFSKHMQITNDGEAYLGQAFGLYERGYIRSYSMRGGQHGVSGNFDSTSLEGWKKGLITVKGKFEKYIKSITKDGVLYDPKTPIKVDNLNKEETDRLFANCLDIMKKMKSDPNYSRRYDMDVIKQYLSGIDITPEMEKQLSDLGTAKLIDWADIVPYISAEKKAEKVVDISLSNMGF